jgi:hypothetical protein
VLHGFIEQAQVAGLAALLFHWLQRAELPGGAGFGAREAGALQIVGIAGHAEADLFVYAALHAVPAEDAFEDRKHAREETHKPSGSALSTPVTPALNRSQVSVSICSWRRPAAVRR